MCNHTPVTYPIAGTRLERLKARHKDESLTHPEEWAQLIRQESPALTRFINHKLGQRRNREKMAEDALTETWLATMRKIKPSYSRPDLQRAFLFSLAWGAVTKVVRDGRRFDHGHGEGDPELDLLNWLEALKAGGELESLDAFKALLDKAVPPLTERERTIVRMRILEDATYSGIAAALQIPWQTVATTYHRAMERLRNGLGDDPSEWL